MSKKSAPRRAAPRLDFSRTNLDGAKRLATDPPVPGYVGVPIPGTNAVRLQRVPEEPAPTKLNPALCNAPCPEGHGYAAGDVRCSMIANHGRDTHFGRDARGGGLQWAETLTGTEAERFSATQLAEKHAASVLGRALALRLLAQEEPIDEHVGAALRTLLNRPEPSRA